MKRLLEILFSRRRWMLWLPLPAAGVLALSSGNFSADFVPMLGGGVIFWIPFWLAWWLSDGFEGMSEWDSAEEPWITCGFNPATGKPCVVQHFPWGNNYLGGH